MKQVYDVIYEYKDDNLIGIRIETLRVLRDEGQEYKVIRRGQAESIPKLWVHQTLESAQLEKSSSWPSVVEGRTTSRGVELLKALEDMHYMRTVGTPRDKDVIDAAGKLIYEIKQEGK